MSKVKLDPPDLKQCQSETLEGSFMTLGPRSYVRCSNKPTHIVKEVVPGEDGRRGSMSLCGECLKVCLDKMGGQISVKPIMTK